MKTLSIIFAMALLSGNSFANGLFYTSIPSHVKESVHSKFPHATHIEITKAENGTYEAYVINERKEMTLGMSKDGAILASETEINTSDVPSEILCALDGKGNIEFAARSMDVQNEELFIIEVKSHHKVHQYIFDNQGKEVSNEIIN